MPAEVHKDSHGSCWKIKEDGKAAEVIVWWDRKYRKYKTHKDFAKGAPEEVLVIRQDDTDGNQADVLLLTTGQVYDLIDALNRAVENW